VNPNPAIFNLEKLEWINGQHLKQLPEAERVRRVEEFLTARGISLDGRSPEWRLILVRAIGDRLKTLADAERYGAFALKPQLEMDPAAWQDLLGKPDVARSLRALHDVLADDAEFSLQSLESGLRGLAKELGLKAGDLIGMARTALTGRKVSPGIFEVMWLLGRERTLERLETAATRWSEETQQIRAQG